jgi:hypothetical protein
MGLFRNIRPAKNIINQDIKGYGQGIEDYGEDITTTNNPTTMTELMGRYPGMDRIQELQNLDFQNNPRDMATGTASDFRHAAAMNELSKSLSPMNNKVGNFIGDSLAYGLGAINEIPDAFRGFSFREGFDPQAMAAAKEDFAANYAGSYGTPNTATIEDVFAKTLGYQAPGTNVVRQTTSGPFNYGTAQAAEVTPTKSLGDIVMEARANEPMDIEDFLGTSTPQDLGFIGMAPGIKEAVAPVGITDRGRGMPGAPTGAYEMIGGTPVAVGDVLGRQQALEKADFVEETPQGINYDALGILGTLGGLITGSLPAKALGMYGNFKSGRTGRALDGISRGIGSLGSKFAGSMRGINPTTGKPNTQAQYEANRTARQQQNRTDRMIDRISKGKKTRSNPRDAGTTKAQKDAISAAIQDSHRGGGGGGSSGKIVCTMMNERYGFGSFRNKIWMKFHEHHGPEYQKGYHAIFLPLVKIAKGEGKINTAVRKVLEHMGRHVTADMFKIMKGKKRDTLGRIYRAIFEPACHIIGKIKSALGRG